MISAIELLNKYGIPYRYATPNDDDPPPTWDGQTLTLDWCESIGDIHPNNVEWTFHEISHHLFAPEESKMLPNYGLGSDPGGGGYCERVKGSERTDHPDTDEICCCLLDLILMHEHQLPESYIRFHVSNYNIQNLFDDDVLRDMSRKYLKEARISLKRQKILSKYV